MGTYILVGIVRTPKLENVLRVLRRKVLEKMSGASLPKMGTHLTILPPFEVDYATATNINLGSLFTEENIRRRNGAFGLTYSVRGIGWFGFEGMDVLHLPIELGRKFNEAASRYREILGDKLKFPLPDYGIWHPHFTVASGTGLNALVGEEMSNTNWVPRPVRGIVSQIVLLAKYADFGYDYLSYDPDQGKT